MIGATALWLMYAWLLAAIVGSYLSNRKGYGEKIGLACGLLLHVVGVIIWLVVPARPNSRWKTVGPVGRRKAEEMAPRATAAADEDTATGGRAASS
jgi:hypothetical protein